MAALVPQMLHTPADIQLFHGRMRSRGIGASFQRHGLASVAQLVGVEKLLFFSGHGRCGSYSVVGRGQGRRKDLLWRLPLKSHVLPESLIRAADGGGSTKKEMEARQEPADSSFWAYSSGPVKQCIHCHQQKELVDFQKSATTRDGRHECCRACASMFRAQRVGRCPDHLLLSVEEAWEKRKMCPACGRVKEVRDFGLKATSKDGLYMLCRACSSALASRVPDKAPVDTPFQCRVCEEVKDASAFRSNKKNSTGRDNVCKSCFRKYMAKFKERTKASVKMPKTEKRCVTCRLVKKAAEFSLASDNPDGLRAICKACRSERYRKTGKSY